MRIPSRPLSPVQAIAVHLDWKLALAQAVRSGLAANLDPDVLGRPDGCELGLWLESPLACFEGTEALRREHRQFHVLAGQLLRRLQDGEDAAALLIRLEDQSAKLVNGLGAFAASDASGTPAGT